MQNDNSKIIVGSLVSAKRDLGLRNSDGVGLMDCRAEEAGVCFAVSGKETAFIFERGGCGGFTPDEVRKFLDVSGLVSKPVVGYEFENVGQLDADYRAGRFSAAFEEQNIERAQERSAWPHPRDILRREYDENLRREGAGIEPKRMDVDLDR
jgi:hypothetical protein